MNAECLVRSFDAHRHVDPALHHRITLVFLAEFGIRGFSTNHRLELGGLSAHHGDQLRQTVGIAVGDVEHTGDILEHGLGCHPVEGDDLRHLVLAVALGDVVDHLTAAFDAEIRVDIRHRLAFGIQEAFEQQPVADRIDVGDPQGVGHQ